MLSVRLHRRLLCSLHFIVILVAIVYRSIVIALCHAILSLIPIITVLVTRSRLLS